jgi:hypothetical protein
MIPKLDVTKTNEGLERLFEVTNDLRHRFLLQAFYRHRYLEIADRYEEIFAPDTMSAEPTYHMHAGETDADLKGQEQIKSL